MDEFNRNESGGQLNGFDSAENNNDGYTVTPDGGFYTKQKADIIQDYQEEKSEPVYTPPETNEPKPNQNFGENGFNGYYYAKQPKSKEKKKSFGIGTVILSIVIAAVIGAVSSIAVMLPIISSDNDNDFSFAQNEDEGAKNNVNINVDKTAESVVEAVAEKVTLSVVGIRTTTSVINFFGGTSESSGDGSGVIISKDGYIVTNYHVIANGISGSSGSKIEVYLDAESSKGYAATVVGYNISSDIAVIKINAKNLTAVKFADSDDLKVGQYVITIGNPGGLEFMDSVTYGVVSGLNRVVSSDSDMKLIQTDAAINPGNSGGALVNTKGELVGINSSKIVSEEFEGMGFAIPSNTVKKLCEDIVTRENAPEPYIGISISERYTADVLNYYGYPNGAVVLSVAEGSPAEKAGLQKGDIITEFDGKEITEYPVLEDCINNSIPGQKVTVKIYRSGRQYSTEITIGYNNEAD